MTMQKTPIHRINIFHKQIVLQSYGWQSLICVPMNFIDKATAEDLVQRKMAIQWSLYIFLDLGFRDHSHCQTPGHQLLY